jgi:hypothetical protein
MVLEEDIQRSIVIAFLALGEPQQCRIGSLKFVDLIMPIPKIFGPAGARLIRSETS